MTVTLKSYELLWNQRKWVKSCLKATYWINLSAIMVFAVIEMDSMMRNKEDRGKRDLDEKRKKRVRNYRKSQKKVILSFFSISIFLFFGANNDVELFDMDTWIDWLETIPHPAIKKLRKSRVKRDP
jgi:hypothetical protein